MLREALVGFAAFAGYYAVAAGALLLLRRVVRMPGELFRKLLHIACVLSIFPLLLAFQTWYLSAGTVLLFAALVYPIVGFLERFPRLFSVMEQRAPGEIRRSLMIAFAMMAILIVVFWGALGAGWRYVIVLSILAWGFGDAAAALFGKAFGHRRFRSRAIEGTKTLEGSLAMLLVSMAAALATLLIAGPLRWPYALLTAFVVALASALVELISHGGIDTLTVPLAASAVAYAMVALMTRLGGAL